MTTKPITPGTGGDRYVPYNERSGEISDVYFTSDLSAEGLKKITSRVSGALKGAAAVKLHTGEPNGPNIIPPAWVKELLGSSFKKEMPGSSFADSAVIVETNTFYEGARYTTAEHVQTLKINGWDFWPVDIMDAHGEAMLPVEGGKWFDKMCVGENLLNYDSMLILTHFKGHMMGGFGGSNKNIGIGCASGRTGKKWLHSLPGNDNKWLLTGEIFMEHFTESSKAVTDHFKDNICFVNVMRNMSVSCDCEGIEAQPVVTPNVGIVASLDILATDQACIDIVYAMKPEQNHDLVERIESRGGHRQLSYMKELGMGNNLYRLIDIDNNNAVIEASDCVKDLVPFDKDNR